MTVPVPVREGEWKEPRRLFARRARPLSSLGGSADCKFSPREGGVWRGPRGDLYFSLLVGQWIEPLISVIRGSGGGWRGGAVCRRRGGAVYRVVVAAWSKQVRRSSRPLNTQSGVHAASWIVPTHDLSGIGKGGRTERGKGSTDSDQGGDCIARIAVSERRWIHFVPCQLGKLWTR